MNKNESLWKEVIVNIHNLHNKPTSYISKKSSNGVWCNITKEIKSIKNLDIDGNDIFSFSPGLGVKIMFGKDTWCGNIPFQTKFPHLYMIE